jgi:hypothetical protein
MIARLRILLPFVIHLRSGDEMPPATFSTGPLPCNDKSRASQETDRASE